MGGFTADPSSGEELFGAIARTGTECELVVYPREGHVPVERAHLLDALQRTRAWFDRHLMIGGGYVAPGEGQSG